MPMLRDLNTPATADPDGSRPWKVVGVEQAHVCTFCGKPAAATCGCPDDGGSPLVWKIGICTDCIVDSVMTRFAAVKHERMRRLGEDMVAAAGDVREARQRAKSAAYKRQHGYVGDDRKWHAPGPFDIEVEAEATRRLAAEEEAIARKHDMAPGWDYDDFEQVWRGRKGRG